MKVEKLGLIFEARTPFLPEGCVSHAQSPQVLPLDDGCRIYFSTRSQDETGKFLSHVSFVEMEGDLRTIRRTAQKPAIELGALGTFDEHGIFPLNVLRVDDEVWGYTTGWNRRVSVSVDTGIGRVVSRDGGLNFFREGDGPVLGPNLHEPFLVGDGFVIRANGQFMMWYIFGTRWARSSPEAAPDRVYKIGKATSQDGINWQSSHGRAVIPDKIGVDECQALPSVLLHDGVFHMVFCYRDIHGFRDDPSKSYRLGYARSQDGQNWERLDDELGLVGTPGDWDAEMQCYPHLCKIEDELYLLYNGNRFGRDGFGLARLQL